jgi:hypothetical protein
MKRVIVEYFEVEVTQPNMLLFVWRQCMVEYFQSLPEAHIFLSTVEESSKQTCNLFSAKVLTQMTHSVTVWAPLHSISVPRKFQREHWVLHLVQC